MQRRFPMLRKLILLIGDMGLLLLATYVALVMVFYGSVSQTDFSRYYYMAPVMLITMVVLFNINGLFSLSRKKYSELLLSLAVALLNLFIVMMAASFLLREFSYSRSVLIITMVLQFIMLAVWKYFFWQSERALDTAKKALLIGSKKECLHVFARLQVQPQLNYNVRYVCSDCEDASWKTVNEDIDLMIVCSDLSLKDKAEIVHFCHTTGKQVVLIPDVYEIFCSGVELDKIDDIPVFRPCYLKPALEQRTLKRMLDVAVSGAALLALWPILIIVGIAIKLDSSGPILYSQVRIGRDEEEFKVYKFRSMRYDAEKNTGPVFAGQGDPRITRLGKILRATRLDELPQLFNVLSGNMSIVGPRPERPFFVEKFKQEIPEYIYRSNVKPGITGLAQVYGKYNTTPYNKLIYDLIYIQKCNVLTDLTIMLQTMKVLVTKSSTEGVAANQRKTDLSRYEISHARELKI